MRPALDLYLGQRGVALLVGVVRNQRGQLFARAEGQLPAIWVGDVVERVLVRDDVDVDPFLRGLDQHVALTVQG